METEIASIRDNPLLDRREIEVEIDHEGEPTPSREDIKSRIAAEEDLDPEKIEVEGIYTGFGNQRSVATLKVFQGMELEDYEDEVRETEDMVEEVGLEEEEEYVETEEVEEPEEDEAGESEEEETGEESEDISTELDYDEIVSGTISDAKDELEALDDPDYEAALEAEKAGKNRTTFIDWLESR